MNPLTILSTAFGLGLMVAAFLFYSSMTSHVSGIMEGIAGDFAAFEARDAEREAGEITVENAPGGALTVVKEEGRRSPRDELLAVINPEVMSNRRRATLQVLVDVSELLDEGEALPDNTELAELTVKVRARAISNALCGAMVERFAASCKPLSEEARRHEDSRYFIVTSTLAYTPADPYGEIPQTETVAFGETVVQPDSTRDVRLRGQMLAYTTPVFDLAIEACETVRQAHGGCGPLSIETSLRNIEDALGGPVGWVRRSVRVGWLEPGVMVSTAGQ